MTATTYPATIPDLRGEASHASFWSGYNGSAHLNNTRLGASMDSGFHSPASTSSLPGRPRSGHEHQTNYSYGRCSQEEPAGTAPYDRQTQPGLGTQQPYQSLKRPFSQPEPCAYQELVQDLRDEGARLTVNQDHKLLSFRRTQDKHTIVDPQGRMQQLELSAQLHGMFFLSEMPSTASDGSSLQPELTCYRRNLFQISGSLVTPRGQLSVVNEDNESVPISSMEVAVSAIESVDGNPVRLIVIPWKTPPPNTPEISQSPDQEPAALPLIPFQGDGAEPDGDYAVYPIGWRRLQFRIATANNGRRKELQQHFVLHLKVFGTLTDGSKILLSEATTAPIVVRGRSPRNFQARKEIPLLGSSAGSRGQALVETGLGVVAGTLSVKPQELKRSVDLQVPRSSFTFSPPRSHAGPQLSSIRSNTFPAFPTSSPNGYPSTSTGGEHYPKGPLTASSSSFVPEPQELPVTLPLSAAVDPTSSSASSKYTFVQTCTSAVPTSTPPLSSPDAGLGLTRYVDQGRPSKSCRHANQQSVHGNGSSPPSEYRYGSSSAPREYYHPSNPWATTTSSTSADSGSTMAYAGNDGRPYSFPHEPYKVAGPSHPATGKMEPRSFEGLSSYSWSAN